MSRFDSWLVYGDYQWPIKTIAIQIRMTVSISIDFMCCQLKYVVVRCCYIKHAVLLLKSEPKRHADETTKQNSKRTEEKRRDLGA